ncbi:uncharacterized protein [Tenebrio molitor]|uniref:uncharacterized protein isoform X3 n=1 Tax=Tenebrio molitor TaxID=7067 RepID=UPI0036248E07
MFHKIGVLLYCIFTIALHKVALADLEDVSEESEMDQKYMSSTHNESMDLGPPDSHEAMNNREFDSRDKRSYEFLMGLVKDSKYESTKTDVSTNDLHKIQGESENATASELLLELMIKIAAHPDQWNKVHKLLENIDSDIMASKKIIEDLQHTEGKTESKVINSLIPPISITKKQKERTSNKTENFQIHNEWPIFQSGLKLNKETPENYRPQSSSQKTYPKTFAYHRVTGRPLYLHKNPKAYIAVSVIAPKPISTRSKDDDLILEKELRQLKPWTHNQNLKNMASLRSRWVIQRDDNIDNLVVA